ncbi:30719_t:CDS:2, partial [Gigaspora margarita]
SELYRFHLSMDKENKKKLYEYLHNNSVTPTPQPKELLPKHPVQISKKLPKQQQQPPPNLSLQKPSTNGEQEIDKRLLVKMTYEQEQAERRRLLEENARPTTIITRSKSREVSKPDPTNKIDNNSFKVQIPKLPERKNIYQTPVRNSEKSQSHVKGIMPSAEVSPTILKHKLVALDSVKKIQYTPKNQKLLPRKTSFTGKEETPISFSSLHYFGKAQRVLPLSKALDNKDNNDQLKMQLGMNTIARNNESTIPTLDSQLDITSKYIRSNSTMKSSTKAQHVLKKNEESADIRNGDYILSEKQMTPTKSPLPEPLTSRRRSKIFQSPVANVFGKARRVNASNLKEDDKEKSDTTPTMSSEYTTPTQSPLRMTISRRRSRIYSSPILNISGKPKRVKIIESIEGLGEEGKSKKDDLDSSSTNAINLTPLNPRKRLSIFPSPSVEVSETSQQFVKMITNKDLNDDIDKLVSTMRSDELIKS